MSYTDKISEIMSTARGHTEKPFLSTSWKIWQAWNPMPLPPTKAIEALRSAALAGGNGKETWTQEQVDERFPLDPERLKEQEEVYAAWISGNKLYSPRALHRQTKTSTNYQQWKKTKWLPDMLTFQEYWFLSEYLLATSHNVKKVNVDRYKHLSSEQTERRMAKTKVGRTYGTWKLDALVSANEKERPVYYRAICQTCGHTVESFNYSRIGHPCGNCKTLARALDKDTAIAPKRLRNPITIWQTKTGWVAQIDRPENAIGKLVIAEFGVEANLEALEFRESEQSTSEPESAYAAHILNTSIPDF